MKTRYLLLLAMLLAWTIVYTPAKAQDAPQPAEAAFPGEIRRYLVVPVKFEDSLGKPLRPKTDYLNLFTDPKFGADIFYRVSSNNRLAFANSEAADAVVLTKPAAEYMTDGKDAGQAAAWNHQLLLDEIGPVLEQSYILNEFYGVVIFPNVPDESGGSSAQRPLYARKGETAKKPLPTICINPAAVSLATLVRELGHHLDLGGIRIAGAASNAPGGMAFIGPKDNRVGNVTCDHIMWHKQLLGWGGPGEAALVDKPISYVFRLFPRSGPPQGLRLVKVPLKPDGEFLTLEAVLPAGIDGAAGLPGFGVLAHRVNEAKVKRGNLGVYPETDWPEAQVSASKSVFFGRSDTWASAGGEVSFKVERITEEFCDVRVVVKEVPQRGAGG